LVSCTLPDSERGKLRRREDRERGNGAKGATSLLVCQWRRRRELNTFEKKVKNLPRVSKKKIAVEKPKMKKVPGGGSTKKSGLHLPEGDTRDSVSRRNAILLLLFAYAPRNLGGEDNARSWCH